MMTPLAAIVPVALGFGALVAGSEEVVSTRAPFGWLGVLLLSAVSALALWRAGSVKAWQQTAEGREERINDLQGELAELRTEITIPERIEGIIRFMGETAERQDAAASVRLELALRTLEADRELHTQRILTAIERTGRA